MTMDAAPRVLIVDDTPANLKLLTDILREGYALSVATNGPDALELAARHLPDLVLMDIMMPGMDGYETCKRLKADKATADIPVIFVTAMHEAEDETRGFDVGAVDYITKPISPPVVKSRVKSAVALRRNTREFEELSVKLSRYLSPQLYDSIFHGRKDVRIGSTRKKLTVFFSDIAGFTATTERLEAETMSDLLNSYLDRMSGLVIKHGGTIDKFMGDAIMAFFGDPESLGEKEDALACVTMAMEMREALKDFQAEWYAKGVETPFHVRAGINTGYCTVGNFGSARRMEYTIIGGQVNVASRLESNAQPDNILISHETWSLVRDRIYCIKKKPLELKGIPHPVQTYQVVDFVERVRGKDYVHALGGLAVQAETVDAGTPLARVREMLGGDPSDCLVAVDQEGRPLGLVMRAMADRALDTANPSVVLEGPVSAVMDREMLVLDPGIAVVEAARQAAARQGVQAWMPVVAVQDDELRGLVPVQALLSRLAGMVEEELCEGREPEKET